MRILAGSPLQWLFAESKLRLALLLGAALIAVVAVACSDDDDGDDPDATQVAGSLVSVTPAGAEASATPPSTPIGGTLVPLDTATPAPSATPSGRPAADDPETVAMIDLMPCGGETLFEELIVGGGVPVLAYKDVPEGTPILFPFERGRLLEADSRRGGILLFYDVPDVGVFSIQAAGSSTLDRNAADVVQGSVIGHFARAFEEGDTEAFEGYQLIGAVGTTELTQVGDEIYVGEALDPNVTDCLVLP
jgi:hypothetical protein